MNKKIVWFLVFGVLSITTVYADDWYWSWSGDMDIACAPSAEGYCTHEHQYNVTRSQADNLYWEIVDIPQTVTGQTRALRIIDNNGSKRLLWLGAGSRPDHHRGPCQSFAHENFRSDHNAVTLTMRFKVEDFPVVTGGSDHRRFYNFEFETLHRKPFPSVLNETTYQFRFEAGSVYRDNSGNLWLRDYREIGAEKVKDFFCMLKPAGGTAKWVKIWAVMRLPEPMDVDNNCIYEMWIDEEGGAGWDDSFNWTDRDKGGWSDVEYGSLGNTEKGTMQFDYICYAYGAYGPGAIAIPAEKNPAVAINPVVGFDKNNLNHIRQQPDGYPVDITANKVVTGIFTNSLNSMKFYYISEADGSGGIRVDHMTGKSVLDTGGNPVTLAVGNTVQLKGGLRSTASEKTIQAYSITRTSTATTRPAAMECDDYKIERSFRTQLNQFVPRQTLASADSGSITAIQNNLLRPWVDPLSTWDIIKHSKITVAGKSWTPDQWRGKTLLIPAQGSHPDLYYTVLANSADTITLTRPNFWTSINVSNDGVAVGQTCMFIHDPYSGSDRCDGRYIDTYGYVTSADAANKVFYINNGADVDPFETAQDIMIPYNSVMQDVPSYTLWQQPNGIRVSSQDGTGSVPGVGQYVRVRGCLGAFNYRLYIQSTFQPPTERVINEIKQSNVMPVVWSEQWQVHKSSDFDRDGDVDAADLVIFCGNWLHMASDYLDSALMPDNYLRGDISGSNGLPDGSVNLLDFAKFSKEWMI